MKTYLIPFDPILLFPLQSFKLFQLTQLLLIQVCLEYFQVNLFNGNYNLVKLLEIKIISCNLMLLILQRKIVFFSLSKK